MLGMKKNRLISAGEIKMNLMQLDVFPVHIDMHFSHPDCLIKLVKKEELKNLENAIIGKNELVDFVDNYLEITDNAYLSQYALYVKNRKKKISKLKKTNSKVPKVKEVPKKNTRRVASS